MKIISLFILLSSSTLLAQVSPTNNELRRGYYLVIGAFEHQENAVRFTFYARKKGVEADFGYYQPKNIYYVYSDISSEKEALLPEYNQYRSKSDFQDAWIFFAEQGMNSLPANTGDSPADYDDAGGAVLDWTTGVKNTRKGKGSLPPHSTSKPKMEQNTPIVTDDDEPVMED